MNFFLTYFKTSTSDLAITGAMLYQLSYKATDVGSRSIVGSYVPVKEMSVKVARYSFLGPIPLKFEHKLRRHKQSLGKIATTVVLDEDENLL